MPRAHLIFLLALGLYTFTLAPDLLPADAGEYQVVGAVLGVAHPPGFALYTLLSWLTTQVLFFVSPALAINFLSALIAAGTVSLLYRLVERETDSALAGVIAAGALAFSTTFWAQATTANVRILAAGAMMLALERVARYRQTRRERHFSHVMLALGIGVAHHASTVFMAAVIGLYAVWLNPTLVRRPQLFLWGGLPFLTWLYFPLRAGSFGAPEHIATLNGFFEHILARGFAGDMLYFASLTALPDRLSIFANILTFQFVALSLGLMGLGLFISLWRARSLGVLWLLAALVHSFIAITYRAPQTVEYLLPAYLPLAVWAGYASAELWRGIKLFTGVRLRPFIALSVATLALGPQASAIFPSYLTLARDTSTRDYVTQLLEAAPPNALILAAWHWATPLWYAQQVEGQRPDVEVRYVYPRGDSLAQTWVDEIQANVTARPVFVTSFYPTEFGALSTRFISVGSAWQALADPLTTPPTNLTGAQHFGDLEFLGFHLETATSSELDQPIMLLTAWRAPTTSPVLNFFVHLVGADGQLYGQMDVNHTRYAAHEVLLNRYTLFPVVSAPPGEYHLLAGAYLPDGLRLAEATLTTLTLTPASINLPATFIPFGNELALASAAWPQRPFHPSETLTVDLSFLAVRPITKDYTINVTLADTDWRWQVAVDATPAGGAIPTLKWIAGSQVTDRHTLTIPADAPPGRARLTLVIYDAFTQTPLPIRDEHWLGQSAVELGEIDVTVVGNQ